MVSTTHLPFGAPGAHTAGSEVVDEKKPQTIETTQYIKEKSSHSSMASATVLGSAAHTGHTGDPSRPSDVSTPCSAHHNPFDTDIEAMITQTTSEENGGRRSVGCRGLTDSQVWPGQGHWKRKAKEQKMKRSRTCLSRLSKRNRLIAKILIGLLIIGIAVGVGLGISKPLGAAIWGQHNS